MFRALCSKIQHYTDSPIRSSYKSCSHVYNLFKGCDDIICSTNFINPSCHRNYQSLILMAIDSNENGSLSNNCSLALACLLKPFMCTKFCQKSQCIQIVHDYCPEAFLFPNIPILFGNIYFGYIKNDFIYSRDPSLIEPYICYNTTDYDVFFRHSPTFLINNIRCVDVDELYVRFNQSNLQLIRSDHISSLHTALQRYHRSMNYTAEICNSSNMYQCIGSSKCINIYSILDGTIDCPHMDDESISLINTSSIIKYIEKNYFKCQSTDEYIPQIFVDNLRCDCKEEDDGYCADEHSKVNYIKMNILFQHICDAYSELLPILIDGNNHTDETECQQWECNNIYTHCNNEWNCPHLEDEINCPHIPKISFNLNCSSNSHPCVSTQMYQSICLPIEKINDGSIDCFGATDEVYDRRISVLVDNQKDNFYCINQNSSLPISIFRLCDDKQDCEYGDDERFCTTNRTYSEYGICAASNIERASDVEKLLCYTKSHARKWQIVEYKMPPINNDEKNNEQQFKSSMFSSELSRKYVHPCHLGLPIRVWINPKNKSFILTCFCPTRYYGPQCQYQNQRISLTLQFQTLSDSWNIPFMIVVSLIDDSNEKVIHSYESFTYLPIQNCAKSFWLTLQYSTRPKDATKQYFIRVDAYEKLTLHHRGSLLFPVEFSFLPVHRLGFIIDIPSNKIQSVSCTNKLCQHGQCMKYWNQPDNLTFCQCEQGWRGKYCQISYDCECSSDAICFDVLSNSRSICLCPKNQLGTRCLISSTICKNNINSTCLNGGECIVTEDYNGLNDEFICLCKQGFTGPRCQNIDNKLILSFDQEITLLQSIFIHFIFLHVNGVKRSTTFKAMSIRQNFVTIYWTKDYHMAFIELLNKHYYLGAISIDTYSNGSIVNKTIQSYDRCPNITELFNKTFLQWHLIRRIKYYHLPCQNQLLNLSCFHDEVHMCLCYDFYGKRLANCFLFEHNLNYDCAGRSECEHNSQCVQDNSACPQQSMCICRDCFFGRKCQFRTDQFGLSLDAILGHHILSLNSFLIQPLIIKISVALTIVYTIIGLINGIFSLITFMNKTVCKVGCGLYLVSISIATILIAILLPLKFFILLLTHMTIIKDELFVRIQCYTLDFFIRVCLCWEQWLAACVACERVVITIQGAKFIQQKSKKAARKVIFSLVLIIILSFLHDVFSRDLIYEDDEINHEIERIWCVVRYQSRIETYNYIVQTFHFIGPFLLNLTCSIILIIKKCQQKSTAAHTNRPFILILQEQIIENKHLLIAPVVLVLLGIPRMILIYTSKCMKSADDVWLYLIGYFISMIPSMLTFLIFVLPSKFYKKQFDQTVARYRRMIQKRLLLRS